MVGKVAYFLLVMSLERLWIAFLYFCCIPPVHFKVNLSRTMQQQNGTSFPMLWKPGVTQHSSRSECKTIFNLWHHAVLGRKHGPLMCFQGKYFQWRWSETLWHDGLFMGVTAHKEPDVRLWGLERNFILFYFFWGELSKHGKPKISKYGKYVNYIHYHSKGFLLLLLFFVLLFSKCALNKLKVTANVFISILKIL